MSLTTDMFGRTIATHMCPECRSCYLGPALCRPNVPATSHAGPAIEALPVMGCTEPPPKRYRMDIGSAGFIARDEAKARELMGAYIDRTFPKRIADYMHQRAFVVRDDVGQPTYIIGISSRGGRA
jgi:hypothetical protein